MSIVLGSWNGTRKCLEHDMLADSMKGRIRYNCTTYVGMDNKKVFEVILDGETIKRFSWETVQSYFHRTGLVQQQDVKFSSTAEYWGGFWQTLGEVPMNERTEYTDEEFCSALEAYRNSDIAVSLTSPDPIQRMFAVLDRRTGKRTLLKMKEDLQKNPDWLNVIVCSRLEAENIK